MALRLKILERAQQGGGLYALLRVSHLRRCAENHPYGKSSSNAC